METSIWIAEINWPSIGPKQIEPCVQDATDYIQGLLLVDLHHSPSFTLACSKPESSRIFFIPANKHRQHGLFSGLYQTAISGRFSMKVYGRLLSLDFSIRIFRPWKISHCRLVILHVPKIPKIHLGEVSTAGRHLPKASRKHGELMGSWWGADGGADTCWR